MRMNPRKFRASFVFSLAIILLGAATPPARGDDPAGPRRVKVLFLGDHGHHEPLERARQAYSPLGRHGIDVVYTDQVTDLNPTTLGRYDVLLLYANIEKIAPDQEKALLDFVEQGHGYAVIHCGSYCFLNSPKLTAVTGARFKSHNTGVFRETIADGDHPIEKGLKPIESWDETYVHEMHNDEGRHILGYRVEGDHKEPYTWTRTQGKGRVFYTAWGHDQRTWGNEDFQALLERGIRWSAGDWALAAQAAHKPFEYTDANVPNYVPGKQWGAMGNAITKMQEPVSPQESMKHAVLRPGFDLKLFASDPQIKKPICMAFDERGRLWVAETFDYPNNMQPAGEGHDQITVCEDTKGDGVADKFTVFADKLSIPTSMVFANGGLIVSQAPDMLFLKDTTGSGHADVRKVLFTGWGTHDTHAGPSNLRWGFDNWIYGTVGYSGFKGTVGGQEVSFGQGVFRFKPDGSKLEFLGSTTNNTWGLGLSEDNQVFGSTANNNPSWYLPLANRYYEQVRGMSAGRLDMIADTQHFYPITEKVRQVDCFGSYTAGAGHALYTARSFPREYWNRVSFVAEPTGHVLGQFVLQPRGSGFAAINDFNLFASDDEWAAPIAAEVGPDGALWMIDWYNFIVQHNPIPKGFEAGKGGAYVTPLRDQRHGRVYRIVWKEGTPSPVLHLTGAKTDQLVAALKSDNLLWRMHGQRLLVEGGDKSAIPALIALVSDKSVDAIGLNPAAIHALWTIHGLGGFDGSHPDALAAAVAALRHPSAGVRKAAADVLPPTAKSVTALLDAKTLEDPDAQVRKSTLLALTEMPSTEAAGEAVFAILSRPENSDDHWIADAAAVAACRHDAGFLAALFAAHRGQSSELPKLAVVNLIPNPSFEEEETSRTIPKSWKVRDYSGKATHRLDTVARTGSHSLRIESEAGSDASMYVDVPVDPGTDYRLSAWIKTENVAKTSGMGALLNVHGTDYRTTAVTGTTDWKKVEIIFNSGGLTTVSINCLYGGWGHATGVAWYDDIELARISPTGLPAKDGKVAATVINQYARRGPVDSVVATLSAARKSDPALAALVVGGLASGWPEGAAPKLSDADAAELREVMKSLPAEAKDRLLSLAGRWGRNDLFPEQGAKVIAELSAATADAKLDDARRADAARRLVAVEDTPASAALVLKQITPTAPPGVQVGMLDALGESRQAAVGQLLVGQYGTLTPTAQKEALTLLLRKSAWTGALLDGVQAGKINAKDLLPQQWESLTASPDAPLASRAKAVQKSAGGAPSADRAEIVKKYIHLADEHGDAVKGKLVFEKNCMVCHTLDGRGGQVGPELNGVGARPRSDILMQILDPNRSVEGTYRQWIIKTRDDVIAGRIFAESKTSIEVLDPAGMKHVIAREDIVVLKATDKGVMPEGLEAIGPQDLMDLLEYLATSKVKR
jgi:putative membrane-bound dehydrogenase-like protein